VSVRDDGPGFKDGDLPHVFDRFYRADTARALPGSGLGLAIVRQVAETHGGAIAVEEAPGGGALFRLTLQRADLAAASPHEREPAATRAQPAAASTTTGTTTGSSPDTVKH
jgi:two-component system sensor histidine kinase MprB